MDHEFEIGDFVSYLNGMDTATGLILDEDYDYATDDTYYEISPSGSDHLVYLFAEDLTLIKGVG